MIKQIACVSAVAVTLMGCQPASQSLAEATTDSSAAVSPQVASFETFKTMCLNNIDQPQKIIEAGNRAGFNMRSLAPESAMGFRLSSDESLQVNAFTRKDFECAVTTSDISDPASVTRAFFAMLGITHRGNVGTKTINGTQYSFLHDTNGGEAFVVFR